MVLIDWFTVGAQIINFLILVLLLKKFLYGPIVKVMAAREAKIQAQLAEAETGRLQAAAAESLAQQHLQELEDKRQALAAQVEAEVAQQKTSLLDAARQEVGQYRQGWLQSLSREKAAFAQTIQNSCSLQAFTLARAIIRELGDVSLEERVLQVFLAKLQQLPPGEEQAFRASLPESGNAAVLASSFPLTKAQQDQILAALQTKFGSQVTIHFETNPSLIAGLELKTRSRKIAWTAEHSLHNLEEKVMEQLNTLPVETTRER
jgi:F-type H+-transporting ATPase subunit b